MSARERLAEILAPAAAARGRRAATPGSTATSTCSATTAPESTGVTQDLMLTRFVPTIYERWWRPALARAVKGVTGPGMSEEVRIARLFLGLTERRPGARRGLRSRQLLPRVRQGRRGRRTGRRDSTPRRRCWRGAPRSPSARGSENLALIRGDATALPFDDASFDCACCFAALHLFADPFAGLDEMRRVLAPGGRIALMTSIRRPVTVRPMKPVVERLSGMRVFEPDEITGALAERGFVDVRQRVSGLVQFVGGRLPV